MNAEQVQRIMRKNPDAEILYGLGAYRHPMFRHDLPPDTPIMRDGMQVQNSQKMLICAKHCLPHRLDVATDAAGNILEDLVFTERYKAYVDGQCVELAGFNPDIEPIPDPVDFILMVPDRTTDSGSYGETGFDPNVGGPPPDLSKTPGKYNTDGERVDTTKSKLEMIFDLQRNGTLTDEQALAAMKSLMGGDTAEPAAEEPAPAPQQEPAPEPEPVEKPAPAPEPQAAKPQEYETAPCGKQVKKGGMHLHLSGRGACKEDICRLEAERRRQIREAKKRK